MVIVESKEKDLVYIKEKIVNRVVTIRKLSKVIQDDQLSILIYEQGDDYKNI